jgi:hypothetical protein
MYWEPGPNYPTLVTGLLHTVTVLDDAYTQAFTPLQ